MNVAIERMRAYRARLLVAGKYLEARAVDRCITIAKAVDGPTGPPDSAATSGGAEPASFLELAE